MVPAPAISMKGSQEKQRRCATLAVEEGAIAVHSPEQLFASGLITASRYHEVLAEMDGRGDGVANGQPVPGFGSIRR